MRDIYYTFFIQIMLIFKAMCAYTTSMSKQSMVKTGVFFSKKVATLFIYLIMSLRPVRRSRRQNKVVI